MAGVTADTPATVLCDGDVGLWRLQREALPNATVVLDWWHAAVRFEHALQAVRGLGVTDAHLAAEAIHGLERAKWRLWHGRWPGCRRKLAALCRWARLTRLSRVVEFPQLRFRAGQANRTGQAHVRRAPGARQGSPRDPVKPAGALAPGRGPTRSGRKDETHPQDR
jgi:hypothetical protein